jgi:hypothetical protein
MADIKAIKGTDGTTYNLRDDYSVWGGENLFYLKNSVAGYLAGANGSITAQSTPKERTSEYIPVEPNTVYTLQTWYDTSNPTSSYNWVCLVWFDSTQTGISQAVREHLQDINYKKWELTSPSNAAYVRISGRWLEEGYRYTNIKFEKGHKATDWSPCYKDIFTYDSTNSQLVVNL